jgi:RimJ/RimL family protein N-acetyltransferase
VRIGAPYRWLSATWSDAQWAEYVPSPAREFWSIRSAGEIAGLADFVAHAHGEVEIATFGLVPEFIGKGIGGLALTPGGQTSTIRMLCGTTTSVIFGHSEQIAASDSG